MKFKPFIIGLVLLVGVSTSRRLPAETTVPPESTWILNQKTAATKLLEVYKTELKYLLYNIADKDPISGRVPGGELIELNQLIKKAEKELGVYGIDFLTLVPSAGLLRESFYSQGENGYFNHPIRWRDSERKVKIALAQLTGKDLQINSAVNWGLFLILFIVPIAIAVFIGRKILSNKEESVGTWWHALLCAVAIAIVILIL